MSQKSYTPEEVSKHNIWEDDEKDVWVVYGDSVYDVTKFIEEHPGGEEVILDVAGDDMTVAFDNMGHSESAKRILEEYKIGRLVCICRFYIILEILCVQFTLPELISNTLL